MTERRCVQDASRISKKNAPLSRGALSIVIAAAAACPSCAPAESDIQCAAARL
jgi:hypothetical protein